MLKRIVLSVCAALAALAAGVSFGGTYYLNKGQADAGLTSSLDGTGGTWTSEDGQSSHQLPVAGNDYVAEDAGGVRTPQLDDGSSFVFPGDSLVLSSTDPTVNRALIMKVVGSEVLGAACVISNLTIRNASITLSSAGILGLAGNLTIPEGCFANFGRTCSKAQQLSLQSNLKGVGTARFPLNGDTITWLSGDNSAFTGNVTVGLNGGVNATFDGKGALCFYTATSWFGNAGTLTMESSSSILEFRENMSISTPNRTVDFGAFKPTIKVAAGKSVVLNARLVGSNGFVKDGDGTLILTDVASGLAGDITVKAGDVLSPNNLPRLSVGARSLILTYAALEDRFVGGSAWLAFGKGETAPENVPDASFVLLRRKLSPYAVYQAAQLVDQDSDYWAVLRYKTVRGATVDFPLACHTLGADSVFVRNDDKDVQGDGFLKLPAKWTPEVDSIVSTGDYCVAISSALNRTPHESSVYRFAGHSVIWGAQNVPDSCGFVIDGKGVSATFLVAGVGHSASSYGDEEVVLDGLLSIQEGAALGVRQNTDIDHRIEVKSQIVGAGKLMILSRDTAHAVRLTGDNGGLTGPVELTKGSKPLSVEFAAAGSWFGDMAAPTADGLKISDGALVKFSKSFVGDTPNRGIDLGTGTPTFEVADGVVAEITSPVRGGGGFVKTGKGTLALMSNQLKGITGTIRVEEGVLELATAKSLSKKNVVLDVAEGAEVRYRHKVGLLFMLQ